MGLFSQPINTLSPMLPINIISPMLPIPQRITFFVNKEQYVLTRLTAADTAELYRVTMQEKSRLRKTLPWLDTIQAACDTEKFLTDSEALMKKGDAVRMSIQEKGPNNTIIGVLSIEAMRSNQPKIGYWLAKAWEGKGIMTTALGALMQEAFNVTAIKRLYLRVASNNPKSKNIAKRLGFTYEATLKEAEDLYGTLVDLDVYSGEKR